MKKLLALLLFAFVLVTFCACTPDHMTKAIEKEIITAFVKARSDAQNPLTKEDISLRVYGEFKGVYVMFVDVRTWGYTQAIVVDVIADVKFVYRDGRSMSAYSQGKFYTLAEAYEQGILSRNDLLTVQKNYKADNASLFERDY